MERVPFVNKRREVSHMKSSSQVEVLRRGGGGSKGQSPMERFQKRGS